MELKNFSQERGIYGFYNGTKYIIFSTFYGVVAESTKIERIENENEEKIVNIEMNICQWYGYWDLKSIITRGIKKAENQYIQKEVNITYNTIENTDNCLNKRLIIETEDF